MVSFSNETPVKSVRKRCQCVACCQMIEIGEPATRCAGTNPDGDFSSVAYHPECRAAEVAFNNLRGTFGEDWGGLDELERWDREWMLAEHPIVAARLGLTAPRTALVDGGESE